MTVGTSVGIFWDFENCRYSGARSGHEIARAIEDIALEYGTVTDFNAYLDMQYCTIPAGTRSELQSSGVALVDCPHNGQKDVVDQMLQTDMLTYALDHPAPATLLLISGDRDFAYTVSVLRRRRYKVVLLCHSQPGPHKSLAWQVSACLDWNTKVLGLPEDPTHRRQWSRSSSSDSSSTDVSFCRPKTDTESSSSSPSASSASLSSWPSPPTSPSNESADITGSSSSPSDTSGHVATPDVDRKASEAPVESSAGGMPTCSAVVPAKGSVYGVYEPLIQLLREQKEAGFAQPNRGVVGYRLQHHYPKVYEDAGVSNFSQYAMRACEAGLVTLGGSANGGETWISLTEGFGVPPILTSPSSPHSSSPWAALVAGGPAESTARPPSAFKPLVRVLVALRNVGENRPKRSLVGNALLATCPDAYAQAGVKSFKQYVEAAEHAGVVLLGGADGSAWVAMSAEYTKRHVGAFTGVSPTNKKSDPFSIEVAVPVSLAQGADAGIAATATLSSGTPTAVSFTSSAGAGLVPATFRPLMRVLQQQRDQGQPRPLYSVVGSLLKASDANVYKKAGVPSFKEYVAAACDAGLVATGGAKGGAEWVAIAGTRTTSASWSSVVASRATPTSSSAPASSLPSTTPAEYRLLVQILQEQRQEGRPRPLRSFVGEQLIKRRPDILKQAKASSSAAYMAQAASLGIVTLSGPNKGAEWISLASASASSTKPSPPSLASVPLHFRELVRILCEYRKAGLASPNRGLIGSALIQRDGAVYARAGVQGFKQYAEKAQSEGIVVLGGDPAGGLTWIALEKKWKKVEV
ncbi:NYN domain-containing protein [Schizophyllum fasciatum]